MGEMTKEDHEFVATDSWDIEVEVTSRTDVILDFIPVWIKQDADKERNERVLEFRFTDLKEQVTLETHLTLSEVNQIIEALTKFKVAMENSKH